jgi:formamidopyrimidine-DNA glycosylase
MPELPEVETTRRGLEPNFVGRTITTVNVREPRLRWPIASDLAERLTGRRVMQLGRRAKYLLIVLDRGTVILHLGMSGALRIVPSGTPPGKHDHIDIELNDGGALRFTDTRRFGSLHYVVDGNHEAHFLLRNLGPEPLSESFDAAMLHAALRGRRASIKEIIMNARVVVGVGNIYASEALFRAGIDPRTRAGRLSRKRCEMLVDAIKQTLRDALRAGGSSLRDWHHADGSLGYFQQHYFAYDRADEPCRRCGASIRTLRQGQRATYYCPECQKR